MNLVDYNFVMATGKGPKLRESLFKKFVANHNLLRKHPSYKVSPDVKDTIICPICMKLIEYKALDLHWDDHLTLEDVPPKSLGGVPCILTCKICNNTAGSQLDVHLLKKLESEEVLSGISNKGLPTRFRPASGIDLSANLYVTANNGISIEYFPHQSNPEHIQRLKAYEDKGLINEISITVNLGYMDNRADVAIIRIAYLLSISLFGYGFLVNPNLMKIRQQIINYQDTVLPHFGIFKHIPVPDDAIGVNILKTPAALNSFLVVFDIETDARRIRYGVLLPGPTPPGLDIYDFLNDHKNNPRSEMMQVTFVHLPDEEALIREDLVLLALEGWNFYINDG